MSDVRRLQLRLVRSHGGSKNIVVSVPLQGCGLADALELGGERLNDSEWRSANQICVERAGAGWQMRNDSRTLVCVVNDQHVVANHPVKLVAGDAVEMGLLRFEVETHSDAAPLALSAARAEAVASSPPHIDPRARSATAAVADAVEFDLRDLAVQPALSGTVEFAHAASLDDPFGVLGIAGAEARPAGDSLAELIEAVPVQGSMTHDRRDRLPLNPLQAVRATPTVSLPPDRILAYAPCTSIAEESKGNGRARPDVAVLLLDGLHDEFVRVVRDADQLAGHADWDDVLGASGERAPTLDELSHRAAPFPLLRDILLAREGIDQIIENFDPLTLCTLLEATEVDDVLHLFAPELARAAKAALPSLTRREHHEVSPDSYMQSGRLPDDTP